jgi:LysM repeat protein
MFVLVVGQPSNSPPSPNSAPDESAAPLIITPIRLAEPAEDGSIVHTLQAGQSLWMVAAYYDADLDYLYQINGRTENDIVQPGDKIYVRLAEGQPPPPTPTPRLSYLVQEGDSAWLIAARHSIELVFFLSLNGIPEDKVLQPGTEVRVRLAAGEDPPPTPTPPVTYKVQEGDSFWSIAAKNDLTVDELLSYNNMTESAFIVPGDELFIRQVDPTPTPTSQPVGTPGAGTGGQTGENTISISNTIPTDFTPAPLVIEAVRSPTPTPTSDPAMIEAMDSANQAMMAEVDADAAVQPNSGGGSIGILIMAISLIGLAALMLYIASRQ